MLRTLCAPHDSHSSTLIHRQTTLLPNFCTAVYSFQHKNPKSQSFHPPSPLAPGKSAEQASCLSLTAQLASEMFKRSKKSNLKHVSSCLKKHGDLNVLHHVGIDNISQHVSMITQTVPNPRLQMATACHNKPRSHVLVSSKFKVPSPLASQVPHSVAKTATDSTALVTLSRSSSRHVMHLILDAIIIETHLQISIF